MPRYDFVCKQEHVTEARRGTATEAILCPACRRVAQRVAIYQDQYIIGATVAKYRRRDATRPGQRFV